MPIPDQLRRSVAFLCYRHKDDAKIRFAGTCFFLGYMPDGTAQDMTEGFFRYTITAKHVIVAIRKKSADGKVLLRVNRKDGNAAYIETDVNDWFVNPDDPSDVAVLEDVPLPSNGFDVTIIMSDMFQRDNPPPREKVRVGDDVFIVGLFESHTGKKRNTPIVRSGTVAMLADKDERIETWHFGDMDAHLIESRSIGGLSGSPVYVHMTDPRVDDEGKASYPGMRFIYLFGLIHGHYDVKLPDEDGIVDDELREETINMGIAIVVPAKQIKETLDHPKLKKSRQDELKQIKDKT